VEVRSAWIPAAFGLPYPNTKKLDKQLTLPEEMAVLSRE